MKTATSTERIRTCFSAKVGGALFLALLALPMAVQAETWYLATPVENPISVPANWTNAQGTAATTINAEDILYATSGSFNQSSTVTHNGAFHAGAEDGSTTLTVNFRGNGTCSFKDLQWHSAILKVNRGSRFSLIAGSAFLDNPGKTHTVGFLSNSSPAGFALNSALKSSESVMSIKIDCTPRTDSPFVIGGDNSDYLGNFRQTMATTPVILCSANALGSPSTIRSDALVVDAANAVLSVTNGVMPNAARGIEINKTGFCICATNYSFGLAAANVYADCSFFELPMPISGDYGFTKDGDGTVTLSGSYTASDIVVANGTLRIDSAATFPAGQKISVASGAALYAAKAPSGFVVDAEPGAVVQFGLDSIVVPYDDSTHTATPVTLDSSYQVPSGTVQEIVLSEPVALPLHVAPAQQEVLTVAAGAADLSADDFVDATEKTYGLPKTSFTVEKDGAGVQHVYLTIRPVVVSVATFDNDVTLNGSSSTWSNGAAAQEGFDYLLTNRVGSVGNEAFAGDSLTVCNEYLYTRADGCMITKATIYAPTLIQQNRAGRNPNISGDILIAGSFDDTSYVTFSEKYNSGEFHRLSATLSGEGPLKVTGYTTGTNIFAQVYGNNSAYKGRIYVTNNGSPGEYTGTKLGFNSINALGGALDTFQYDSLELDRYSMMRPATSMTFATENRGIYGSGPFGFDVQDGTTFTVGVPIKMDDDMFKHGGGDLLLGGAISFGEDSSKTCYVREGGIGALADAAVAGLNVVFSNGTKIVVSREATLVNGFTGVSFEPADATVSVGVAGGSSALPGEKFTAVIATVPTSAGDLSSRFELEEIKGFTGTIVTEGVAEGEIPCTRYSAKYTHCGLVIFVR